MKISIIIVTWNSSTTLGKCLSAILQWVQTEEFEIIVVDNASQDNAYLSEYRNNGRIKIIENPSNLGFAKANNIGVAISRGEYILILNPDVYLISNPFPRLLIALKEHPEITAIGPMLINEKGLPQIEGYYYKLPTLAQTLLVRTWLTRLSFIRRLSLEKCHSTIKPQGLTYVEQIPGAFLLFNRNDITGPEYLNEAYFIWMEDVDFCKMIADSGKFVAVLADEKAIHVGGTSFHSWSNQRKMKTAFMSYATYLRRHHGLGRYIADHLLLLVNSVFLLVVISSRSLLQGNLRAFTNTVNTHSQMIMLIASSLFRYPFITNYNSSPN